jgi:hypothetical protein
MLGWDAWGNQIDSDAVWAAPAAAAGMPSWHEERALNFEALTTDHPSAEFMARMMSNLDGEKDAEIKRLRAELEKAHAEIKRMYGRGACGEDVL